MKYKLLIFFFIFLFSAAISYAYMDIKKNIKKCMIVYYSETGNTKKLAENLKRVISRDNYIVEIKRISVSSKEEKIDLSGYNLIAFGSPVHFGKFVLPIQEYILKAGGMEGKEVILFSTYARGSDRKDAFRDQEAILNKKGVLKIKKIALPGAYANINKNIINEILGFFLYEDLKNINVLSKYVPLMDIYHGPAVRVSGTIKYGENLLEERGNMLAVWSERAFDECGTPDIDIIDLDNKTKKTVGKFAHPGHRSFEIAVPKGMGKIFLGVVDCNIMHLPRPYHFLNSIENLPLDIQDSNINGVSINVSYRKVYISGEVREEGSFMLGKGMRVLDLIKESGGFLFPKQKLRITVRRNSPSKGINVIIDKLPANDPSINILLEVGDHIIVEKSYK